MAMIGVALSLIQIQIVPFLLTSGLGTAVAAGASFLGSVIANEFPQVFVAIP